MYQYYFIWHEYFAGEYEMQIQSSRKSKLTARLIACAGSAVVLAAGNAAYATVISFDNSDLSFNWNDGNLLDITRAALDQDGAYNSSTFYQSSYRQYAGYGYDGEGGYIYYYTENFYFGGVSTPGTYVAGNNGYAYAFNNIDDIGTDDFNYANSWAYIGYIDQADTMQTDFNERGKFAGVQFDLGGVSHLGWIELVWNPDGWFDAYSWGYKTDDDPEDIPEPGTLGLFAVGVTALAVARRRRKNKTEEE